MEEEINKKPASYLDRLSGNIVARAQRKAYYIPKSQKSSKPPKNSEIKEEKPKEKPKTEPKVVQPQNTGDIEAKILEKLSHLELLIKEKDSEIDGLKEQISALQSGVKKPITPPPTPVTSDTGYHGRHQRTSS